MPLWKDVDPRVGAAYDLFGNGTDGAQGGAGPIRVEDSDRRSPRRTIRSQTSINSVNRTWNDTNGNYVPDCDLANRPRQRRVRALGEPELRRAQRHHALCRRRPRRLRRRGYNWDFTTEVQHQLRPGVSMTGGYYRNWFGNFLVTDNTLVTPADFDPFCITAPTRFAAARRRRVSGLRPVRRSAGEVRPGQQRGDAGRRTIGKLTARQRLLQRQHQRAARLGPSARRRRRHRAQRQRRLLRRRFSRRRGRQPSRQPVGLTAASATPVPFTATTINGQTICRIVTPFKGQTQVKGFMTLPVAGRLRRERHLPEHLGADHHGELRGDQRPDRAVARPQPGGLRDPSGVHVHGHGSADRPADDVRRSVDAARPAPGQTHSR